MDWAQLGDDMALQLDDIFVVLLPIVTSIIGASLGYALFRKFVG